MVMTALLLPLCVAAVGQTYTLQDFVSALQDDERTENAGWQAQIEEWADLAAHPMDINTATREDFRKISILSDGQIEAIHSRILLLGGVHSLSELMAIDSLDIVTYHALSLFFYAGQDVFSVRRDTVNAKNLWKNADHELTTRLDIPLYYREGYMHSSGNGGYNGSPLYNRLRYTMQSMNHVQLGLSGEKDAGEPFRGNKGYDSYSGYLVVKNIKWLRTAVVGDYKLGFGEGLVVNNGFSVGKVATYSTVRGVKPKTSMDEYDYLRGAAVDVRLSNVDITAWVAKRRLDATLNADGGARTIQTSGLHRTDTELSKKGNLGSFVAGGDVSWAARGVSLGATGYYQRFSLPLSPGDADYRRFYPRGTTFGVMGIHYGYDCRWFTFSGETAYSTEQSGFATFNKLVWKISTSCKLTGSQRFYQMKYRSFYASALCENSYVQNESGGMLKLDAQLQRNWTIMAYADFFYNPWPRYRMTHSSAGQDFTLFTEYSIHNGHRLSLRHQLKRKESGNTMQTHNRTRLRYTADLSDALRLQTILNLHSVMRETGFSLSQNVRYHFGHKNYRMAGALTYFHTPDYATRVCVSEPSLQTTLSYPSVYGHGMRGAFVGSCSFWHMTLEAKCGVVYYFDRTTQSSGMQTIYSRWKSDISVQIRMRF